jgi:hypothetical protein
VWGLRIFGGEVIGALGCKVFVPRIILPINQHRKTAPLQIGEVDQVAGASAKALQ